MNKEKLKNIIDNYKKHMPNISDLKDINERNARKEYYQSWTKESILKMNEDEFESI